MSMVPTKKGRPPARRFRKPNALKHGAYSEIGLLPWEHPDEFQQLRREIWDELQPEGFLQEECAEDILHSKWRKRRLRTRRKLEAAAALDKVENQVFREQPPPLSDTRLENFKHAMSQPSSERRGPARDDYEHLLRFSASLYREIALPVLKFAIARLPHEFRDHLNAQVPQEKFDTTEQWVSAVKYEVDYVLMPMVRKRHPDPRSYLDLAIKFLADDPLLEDLDVEDRLDAVADRALKRLFWLKTQKQLDREARQKVVNGKPAPRPRVESASES